MSGPPKLHQSAFVVPRFSSQRIYAEDSISFNKYTWGVFAVGLFGIIFFAMSPSFQQKFRNLQANIFLKQKVEFTGAVFPVKKVPNWVALTPEERKLTYSQLPKNKFINLPDYNLQTIKEGTTYNANTSVVARNTYITYPVTNLGNYNLDGRENAGSHPGIDIKVPKGTPIEAISNGVIEKVGYQSNGYGNFVVIRHMNVPNVKEETLFSNYAHLSRVSIKEGDIVKKGQTIGFSGSTGMSTAPHLHFQVDNIDAPYHPYWPFSWEQIKQAGIKSYFQAVNQGLGRDRAQKYTVHPFNFIAQNLNTNNSTNILVQNDTQKTNTNNTEDAKTVVVAQDLPNQAVENPAIGGGEAPEEKSTPKLVIPEAVQEVASHKIPSYSAIKITKYDFEIQALGGEIFIPGQEKKFKITTKLAELLQKTTEKFTISTSLKSLATVSVPTITAKDFEKGSVTFSVKTNSSSSFRIFFRGNFGEIRSNIILPQSFLDIARDHPEAKAIASLKGLAIIGGYPDNTFRPNNPINRAEALKIILEANDVNNLPGKILLSDVAKEAWYSKYVQTAVTRGIVTGYADGTFRPSKPVSRAEFLKMAIRASGMNTADIKETTSYSDVPKDAWFSPYFFVSKKYNLIEDTNTKQSEIFPIKNMTRSEAARVIYRLQSLDKNTLIARN